MSAKTLIIATVALAATAATALPSLAAPSDQTGQPNAAGKMSLRATIMFNLLDRNGDGSIDKDELNVVRDAVFAALDTNNDGKLSQDEVAKLGRMIGGPRPGDMRMGRQDFHGGWNGPNRDGRPNDRQGQNDNRGPRHGKMDRMGFNGGDQGPQGAGTGPNAQNFASLDANGDGTVSQDEFGAVQLPFPNLQAQ
jgi:EF hand/EF-hand domain pair